ncbi:MAG: nucleoside deaminase [Bdellovibrionales bacterium]|nr:nucleoside deaminase [Bdellovibrionales bacterium]
MNKENMMNKAIELSKENMCNNNGGPFGAIIAKDNKIIGKGWNCVTGSNDPTAHAEVQAIRDACKNINTFDLSGCEIYTSCEPCPMCLSAIYWARLNKIYYANTSQDAADINFDDSFIYSEIKKSKNQRQIPLQQLMQKEALTVFKLWQKKEDKILY